MKTTKTGKRTMKSMRGCECGTSCSTKYKKTSFWSKLFRFFFGYPSRRSTSTGTSKGKKYSSKYSGRKMVSLRAKKSKSSSTMRRNKKMAA